MIIVKQKQPGLQNMQIRTNMINDCSLDFNNEAQPYLQSELQLSAVACFFAGNGYLTPQLQGHGAIQDA